MNRIDNLIEHAGHKFDLTDPKAQLNLYRLTDKLLNLGRDEQDELIPLSGDKNIPLEFRMAIHLMKSKRYLNQVNSKAKIGIVFAMWGEHHRLYPKTEENPNGEDTLRTKINQLSWATENSNIEWHLYAVDDGCPYGSGKIAEKILSHQSVRLNANILFLEDAISTNQGSLKNLKSIDDSKKGGAIILGCSQAIADGMEAVIYTDADNSVHLGQIGILLKPYLEESYRVVLGNRKDPLAVLVKQESRWGIGIKLLRHMQRMVGNLIFSQGILDSQAAFKLYDSQILYSIISDPAVFDFSFDSDWIAAIIKQKEKFAKVPFAFVDSFAESASVVQGPMTTWETLLMGLVKSVRHRELAHNQEMAHVLVEEIQSAKDLEILINHLPTELESVEDKDLGNPEIMSPQQVQDWIKLRKRSDGNNA